MFVTGIIAGFRFSLWMGEYVDMWTDLHRPTDIVVDKDGSFYVSEYALDGSSPRISILDKQGKVLARWDSRSAHGLWVDPRGDIYLALSLVYDRQILHW